MTHVVQTQVNGKYLSITSVNLSSPCPLGNLLVHIYLSAVVSPFNIFAYITPLPSFSVSLTIFHTLHYIKLLYLCWGKKYKESCGNVEGKAKKPRVVHFPPFLSIFHFKLLRWNKKKTFSRENVPGKRGKEITLLLLVYVSNIYSLLCVYLKKKREALRIIIIYLCLPTLFILFSLLIVW